MGAPRIRNPSLLNLASALFPDPTAARNAHTLAVDAKVPDGVDRVPVIFQAQALVKLYHELTPRTRVARKISRAKIMTLDRRVIIALANCGFNYRNIQKILNLKSLGTVRSRLSRARALQRSLAVGSAAPPSKEVRTSV